MVDVEKTIIPVLVIPLLLLIMVAVYMNASSSTQFVFENTVINETHGTADGNEAFSSTYDCKENSVTAVTNGTQNCATPACYNVTYVDQGRSPCTFVVKATAGTIRASYTAYKDDGYTAYEKVDNLTFQGFKLSGLLPYVVVAMTILAVVVGAFALV